LIIINILYYKNIKVNNMEEQIENTKAWIETTVADKPKLLVIY